MERKGGKGFIILAIIIGSLAMGMGAYAIIQNLELMNKGCLECENEKDLEPKNIIIGLWENLSRNMDNPNYAATSNWLIEMEEPVVINNTYVICNDTIQHNNTRLHLIKMGWYRVNLLMRWEGIAPMTEYSVNVLKNNMTVLIPDIVFNPSMYYVVSSQFYISSDGTDYYEFNCKCSPIDNFIITTEQERNQLMIEFLGEF